MEDILEDFCELSMRKSYPDVGGTVGIQTKGAASARSGGRKACSPPKNHKEFSTTIVWSSRRNGTCDGLEGGKLPGRKVSRYAVSVIKMR